MSEKEEKEEQWEYPEILQQEFSAVWEAIEAIRDAINALTTNEKVDELLKHAEKTSEDWY